MKTRLFVLICLAIPFLGRAQGFELFYADSTQFNQPIKAISIPNEDSFLSLYMAYEANSDTLFFFITKIDELGGIIWNKKYETIASARQIKYAPLSDGFLLVCDKSSGINKDSLTINKFNFEGELVNTATQKLPDTSIVRKIKILQDYSIVCITKHFITDSTNIIRVAQDGSLIWSSTFAENQIDSYDNYTLVGSQSGDLFFITKNSALNDTTLISKIDQNGHLEWQTMLSSVFGDINALPTPTDDGLFIWGSPNSSGGSFIGKLNSDGDILWSQDFASHVYFANEGAVILGEGNTIYMAGLGPFGNGSKFTLVHLNENGDVIWDKKYTDGNTSEVIKLIRSNDGGFILAGQTYTGSIQTTSNDPYVLKLDSEGTLVWEWYSLHQGQYALFDAENTNDNGCIITGIALETYNQNQDRKMHLAKLDSNGLVYAHFVVGQLDFDKNHSCTYDNGEPSLANWKIKGTNYQTTYATTQADGSFWLPTNGSSVQVSAIPPNACWTSCPDPLLAVFPVDIDTVGISLFAQAIKNCPVLEVDASAPLLRRCFSNTYHLECKNTGTVATDNLKMTVLLDSFFIFQNASLPVATQNGNELVFNIGSLGINESISLTIQVEVSCDAVLGQVHCLILTASADNECSNGGSREFAETIECQPNVGSYDPNDKRAFTEGTLTDRFIAADSIIEYQIRFQNTGTDTAFTVVITDTLSSLLDIESIHAGASSHAYHLELERNNILKFVFKDIMLPDSNINEPASHGFVKFRIRHKPALVPGNVIPNKAAIFFDFNEAVITNNLELEIKSPPTATKPPRPVPAALLKVYPQPAADVVVFELKSTVGQQPCRLEILNLLGQRLYDQSIKKGANTISHLPAGQHFYRLWRNGEMVEVGKVLIVR